MNVLLKELESCPVTCIIIGATNHPDLLDKAIWRRFDRALEITLPEKNQRQLLLQRGMGKRLKEITAAIARGAVISFYDCHGKYDTTKL